MVYQSGGGGTGESRRDKKKFKRAPLGVGGGRKGGRCGRRNKMHFYATFCGMRREGGKYSGRLCPWLKWPWPSALVLHVDPIEKEKWWSGKAGLSKKSFFLSLLFPSLAGLE